jgi:nickel/cobalt exporter
VGWREITARGDGMTVTGDLPQQTVSQRLLAYPADLLRSPLDVRSGRLSVRAGGARLAPIRPAANAAQSSNRGVDALTAAFTRFVGRPRFTIGVGVLAVLLSVVLGAAHAFAPGHGKTVMAAYLIGDRASLREGVLVAASVTVTHTAGVLVLGAVLTTAVVLAPVTLYAWLGIGSGILLMAVGASLFVRALRGRSLVQSHAHPHPHSHDDVHDHSHDDVHGHSHDDVHGHSHDDVHGHSHEPQGVPPIRRTALVVMGFAGGLVPSPSAVVVLLGAVSLGRTWFGVLLVLGYGLGMALTLVGLGVVLARWGGRLQRRAAGGFGLWLRRTLPVVAAAVIMMVGLAIATQAGVVAASA